MCARSLDEGKAVGLRRASARPFRDSWRSRSARCCGASIPDAHLTRFTAARSPRRTGVLPCQPRARTGQVAVLHTPLRYRIRPGALRVLVPSNPHRIVLSWRVGGDEDPQGSRANPVAKRCVQDGHFAVERDADTGPGQLDVDCGGGEPGQVRVRIEAPQQRADRAAPGSRSGRTRARRRPTAFPRRATCAHPAGIPQPRIRCSR